MMTILMTLLQLNTMITKQSIEFEFVEDPVRQEAHAVAKVILEIRTEDLKCFPRLTAEDRLTLRIAAMKQLQRIRLPKF